jgi:hypothetical protein
MPISESYRTWIQRICELRPKQQITQVKKNSRPNGRVHHFISLHSQPCY